MRGSGLHSHPFPRLIGQPHPAGDCSEILPISGDVAVAGHVCASSSICCIACARAASRARVLAATCSLLLSPPPPCTSTTSKSPSARFLTSTPEPSGYPALDSASQCNSNGPLSSSQQKKIAAYTFTRTNALHACCVHVWGK